jgi:hypothetical protein
MLIYLLPYFHPWQGGDTTYNLMNYYRIVWLLKSLNFLWCALVFWRVIHFRGLGININYLSFNNVVHALACATLLCFWSVYTGVGSNPTTASNVALAYNLNQCVIAILIDSFSSFNKWWQFFTKSIYQYN